MKNLLSILFLLCICANATFAQGNRSERIDAMRIAYITEELDLTVEEAQVFWPIFNEYEAKRKDIRRSFDHKRDIDTMTNEEATSFVEESFVMEQKTLDLKREYVKKMSTVISMKKIARLQKTEKKFRQELLKRMKQRREGRGRG